MTNTTTFTFDGRETGQKMRTITIMELRQHPGEYAFRVRVDLESFLVTYQGKPCFKMVPVSDVTVIRSDGSMRGPKPLTMGLDLGGEYARGMAVAEHTEHGYDFTRAALPNEARDIACQQVLQKEKPGNL